MSIEQLTIKIDSTALGNSHCEQKLAFNVVKGCRSKATKSVIVYGTAFHKFMDTMFKTGGKELFKARDAALEVFRQPKQSDFKKAWLDDEKHFIGVCHAIWTEHVEKEKMFQLLDLNGIPASELTFSLLIYEDNYLKVYLEGTIDNIGKLNNSVFGIRDWKCTTYNRPEEYLRQYEMNRQLRIYRLACKMMEILHPDSILAQISQQRMVAFIDGIFITSKAGDVKVNRSDFFYYDDNQIEEMKQLIIQKCIELSQAIRLNDFRKTGLIHGTCMGKFSECEYWNYCKVQHEGPRQAFLDHNFVIKPYEPLKFNE